VTVVYTGIATIDVEVAVSVDVTTIVMVLVIEREVVHV